MQALAATRTPGGAAVAVGGEDQLSLLVLGPRGKLRRRQQVDDPRADGASFLPRLSLNGQRLCVAWSQADNHDDRLLVRLFGHDGAPQTPPAVMADHVDAVANVVPHGDGFRLTWASHAQRRYQLRTRRISGAGAAGPAQVLVQGTDRNHPLAAGLQRDTFRLVFVDTAHWPHRLQLKELRLP